MDKMQLLPLKNRKYPRLKNKEIYSVPGTIGHIIIGTDKKEPYFNNHEYAEVFTDLIIKTSEEKNNRLYAYCVMPDHIHILIESSGNCSIVEYIRLVKGRFSAHCRNKRWDVKLQRSFYDHLLRKEEDIEVISKYIIGNPLRAGLATSYGNYPFAGSLVFDI
jgi:putative transposase